MDLRVRSAQGGDRVHHDDVRPEAVNIAVHAGEVHLQAEEARARRLETQEARVDVGFAGQARRSVRCG